MPPKKAAPKSPPINTTPTKQPRIEQDTDDGTTAMMVSPAAPRGVRLQAYIFIPNRHLDLSLLPLWIIAARSPKTSVPSCTLCG